MLGLTQARIPLLGLIRKNLASGLGWPPISMNTGHEVPRYVLERRLIADRVGVSHLSVNGGILLEVEHTNQSGLNESMIMEKTQKLYIECVVKRFDLEHWYEMLQDQPKWKTTRDPLSVGQDCQKGIILTPES